MSSRPVHQPRANTGVRMRATQRPPSVPTLTNGMHSLRLFCDNELVGPDDQPGDKRKRDATEELLSAATSGNTEDLKRALNDGADPNIRNTDGETALMFAVKTGRTECLEALLEHGADLTTPNELGWTALMFAAAEGHTTCLKTLLARGADPNIRNNEGETALMKAAYNRNLACLNALLEHDADPNLKDLFEGETALMKAAYNEDLACLNALLEHDADPNLKDTDGGTALMIAVIVSNLACLKALHAKGEDLNVTNDTGWTALMFAAQHGKIECLNALLAMGADLTTTTKTGWTALKIARSRENQSCVQILEAAAAAAAAKENQADPSELDDGIHKRIEEVQKIYAERRLRLKQLLQDRQRNVSDLNALHSERVQRADLRCPDVERDLKEREDLRKQVRELQLEKAYTADLVSLNLEEQTKLREIEAKRQELHQKYSEAYVTDHRCDVCSEIKVSLGVAYGCGHRVCKRCADQWKDSCPFCRHKSGTHQIHASVRGLNTVD